MENVVLTVHLLLALALIGIVLLQRSEGGGLGMGGSNTPGGGRAAASPLSKVTWALAIGFICTSIALTILAAKSAGDGSVLDRLGAPAASESPASDASALPTADDLLVPPAEGDTAPLVPRAD